MESYALGIGSERDVRYNIYKIEQVDVLVLRVTLTRVNHDTSLVVVVVNSRWQKWFQTHQSHMKNTNIKLLPHL